MEKNNPLSEMMQESMAKVREMADTNTIVGQPIQTPDGVGMSPERREELTRAMEQGERVGFGLSTVHERVRLFFGPPYGLSISSQEGIGTTISVRIPWRKEDPV